MARDQLKRYILNFNNGVSLTDEEVNTIYQKLLDASSDISIEEHIQNIK